MSTKKNHATHQVALAAFVSAMVTGTVVAASTSFAYSRPIPDSSESSTRNGRMQNYSKEHQEQLQDRTSMQESTLQYQERAKEMESRRMEEMKIKQEYMQQFMKNQQVQEPQSQEEMQKKMEMMRSQMEQQGVTEEQMQSDRLVEMKKKMEMMERSMQNIPRDTHSAAETSQGMVPIPSFFGSDEAQSMKSPSVVDTAKQRTKLEKDIGRLEKKVAKADAKIEKTKALMAKTTDEEKQLRYQDRIDALEEQKESFLDTIEDLKDRLLELQEATTEAVE